MAIEQCEDRIVMAHNLVLDFNGGLLDSSQGYLVPPNFGSEVFDGRNFLAFDDFSNDNRQEQILQIVAGVRDDMARFDINVVWDDLGAQSPFFRAGTQDQLIMIVGDDVGGLFGIASDVDDNNDNGRDSALAFGPTCDGIHSGDPYHAILEMILTISHEAGHNYGLSHTSEADADGRQVVGGATVPYSIEFDHRFSIEALDHEAPEAGVVYAETDRMNQNLGPAPVVPVDDFPGQTLPQEPLITTFDATTGASGAIDFGGDRDAFKFTATTSGTIRLRQLARSGNLAPQLSVWDDGGAFIASGLALGAFSDVLVDVTAGQTYFVVAGSTFDRLPGFVSEELTTGDYDLAVLPADAGETVALDDSGPAFTTDEDTPFTTGSVLLNDIAGDLISPLTVIDFDTTGTLGIVTNNGDGTFDYDPNGLFNDLDLGESATTTFTYTITDGETTDTATVTITITGLPDPDAVADGGIGFTTDEDTPFRTASVLANDETINPGDTPSIFSVNTTGLVGTLVNHGDGTFTYDPGDHFQHLQVGLSATTSFSYVMTDGDGGFDETTVTITILGVNDAPVARDDGVDPIDGFVTTQDQRFTTANVLDNDFDIDLGDSIRFGFPAPTGNPINLNNWVVGGTGSMNIDVTGTKGIVWDNGDGTFDYDPNGQFEGLGADETATDSFRYIIFDEHNEPGIGVVTISITGANEAPIARAGGPYFVAADQPLALDASRSRDADAGDQLTYRWDINGDGHFTEGVEGEQVTVSPAQLAAMGVQPGVHVVTVAVSDGLMTTQASATLSVGAAPTVQVNGPSQGVPGQTLSYRFAAPGAGDVRYEIDWNSDGVVDQTVNGPASGVFASNVFAAYGPVTVSATAFDSAGEIVAAGQHDVNIVPVVQVGNVLFAGGTAGRDRIEFSPGAGAGEVLVRVNRQDFGPFTSVNQLFAFGNDGNDTLQVATSAMLPQARLHGGGGNDQLFGGLNSDILRGEAGRDVLYGYAGADTLYGGDHDDVLNGHRGNDSLFGDAGNDRLNGAEGDDLLRGGSGRDYMIAGLGNDVAVGGDGDDRMAAIDGRDVLIGGGGRDLIDPGTGGGLMIGGSTTYDNNDAALRSILNEWASGDSLSDRSGALYQSPLVSRQGSSPYWLEFGVTVRDDGARDLLASGDDEDWYLAFARDTLPDAVAGDRIDRA
jgi:VCBS repeat-containing protein